ncbi:MAG: LL-diaminopimelate aminotransferase [Planctomycetes bacterium]|nr:LL-diaminopimelate aminotransferase [Planctomycetota bacterium]
MSEFLTSLYAARIGGGRFGKGTAIYKFEKIKRAKAKAIEDAKQRGIDLEILDFGVGEPDDMAPPGVVEILAREAARLENRTYADNGIPEFRQAAARYMAAQYGVEGLDPATEICHAIGSKNALSFLPACFIDPGDYALMTVPGYPVMGTHATYFGGRVYDLPLREERGFLPDLDAVPGKIWCRAKMLYLNYPNNPTGACATPEFFDHAIALAKKHGFVIVSDAAYAPLAYGKRPLSILSRPGAKEVAVELHSMSKGFNMTGWRLSWVCGSPGIVSAFASVKDNYDSGQFRAIQKAAIWALEHFRDITSSISEKYERRLRALVRVLSGIGFRARPPEGSFYLYVPAPRGIRGGQLFRTAEEFCEFLIEKKGISTVPWDDVGPYLRFSVTFVARTPEEEGRVFGELAKRLADLALEF